MSQSSQVSKPNISDDLYHELVEFIVLEVRQGPTDPRNGGVYAQTLTNLYLDRYVDKNRLEDEPYLRKEKKLIAKLLWWLVEDNTLKLVKRTSGGTGFIINPDYYDEGTLAREMDLGFNRLKGVNGASDQHQMEDEEIVRSIEGEGQLELERMDDKQYLEQTNDLDMQGDLRDSEEDDDMTKDAFPLSALSVSPMSRTPRKKRTMSDLITDSNMASRRSASSPDSSPGGASKRRPTSDRIRTLSESLRELIAYQPNTPKRRKHAEKDSTPLPLMLETKLKDPEMVKLLTDLRSKYPTDRIDICSGDGYLECKDCEKSYKAWTCGANPKRTANNMITHLKSKSHRDMAQACRGLGLNTMPTPTYQTGSSTAPVSTQPVQMYGMSNIQMGDTLEGHTTQQALQSAKASLFQFMDVIEKDTVYQAERNKTLEEKFNTAEMLNRETAEKMNEVITLADFKITRQCEMIDRQLATSEAQSEGRAAKMHQQFLEMELKMQKQIDELKEEISRSETVARTRFEQLEAQLASSGNHTEAELLKLGDQVALFKSRADQQHRDTTEHIAILVNEKANEYKEMTDRLTSLVKAKRKQSDELDRLGAILQFNTETVESYEQNEAELRRMLSAHEKESAKRAERSEKESFEQFSAVQIANMENMRLIERTAFEKIEALKIEHAAKTEMVEHEALEAIRQVESTCANKLNSVARQIAGQASLICELDNKRETQTMKLKKLDLVLPKLIKELGVYHSIAKSFVRPADRDRLTGRKKFKSPRVRKIKLSEPRRRKKFISSSTVKKYRSSMKLP